MTRLRPLNREDVPELEDVFTIKEDTLGFLPNSALIMARWPELARAYGQLSAAIAKPQELPVDLSELVFLVASLAGGCRYCQAHSAHAARALGVAANKLREVWNFETSPLYSEAERVALRVTAAAAGSPATVTDEQFRALQRHFSERVIVELAGVVAFAGFMNRWNATMATPLEGEPLASADELLQAGGWYPGIHANDSPVG